MSLTGARMVHVPFAGSTGNGMAVAQGTSQLTFDVFNPPRPHVEKGTSGLLAVTTSTRAPEAPDVPTINETGAARMDFQACAGLAVPARTAPNTVDKLAKAHAVAPNDPAASVYLRRTGAAIARIAGRPAEFGTVARQTADVFDRLIRDVRLDVE